MVDSRKQESGQDEFLDSEEYLNIYGQYSNHDVVFIVGTERALLELRNQIDRALVTKKKNKSEYWTSD